MKKRLKNWSQKLLITSLFCAIMALAFSSCRTTKQSTTEKTSEDTKISLDVSSEKTTNHQEKSTTTRADETRVDENVTEIIIETEWSKPDSAGKQYPAKTTNTSRHKSATTTAGSHKKIEQQANTDTSEEIADKSKLTADNATKKIVDNKAKSKAPAWAIWSAVILSLGLVVLVYLMLKRFKIVN